MSVDPEKIAKDIKRYIPQFSIDYKLDPVRQRIAESWPNSLDTTAAAAEWGFNPKYNLEKMTKHMLTNISAKNNRVQEYKHNSFA
jgi:nucleoside-diphosphate-sugar epimerase